MGLDMFFLVEKPIATPDYKKHKTLLEAAHRSGQIEVRKDKSGQLLVRTPIASLRKANAVHGWIIREVANGVDDCKPIQLTREALSKLLADCDTALARRQLDECTIPVETPHLVEHSSLADALASAIKQAQEECAIKTMEIYFSSNDPLRPTVGPFFGSYQKDAAYYANLEYVCELIKKLLSLPLDYRFYYQASW